MNAHWIDTHAHLTDPKLSESIDAVLQRASDQSVSRILCVGIDVETSERAVGLAQQKRAPSVPSLWASVGIHPNHAHLTTERDWPFLRQYFDHPRVCALGETGLDRYWDDCPFETQLENFALHWSASRETGLPVIIHARDCDREMLEALRRAHAHGPLNGVMHSFAGTSDMAMECLAMGLYISFSGIVTYKKNGTLREVAAKIPRDRLLVETDSPYLSPDPVRSVRPNEPALMIHTARVVAEAQKLPLNDLANLTTENALRLFSKMR